jgi:hypothetical protein
MADELETTMALLARTPGALDVLLRGLPEAWTLGREGEGTWNACDIVGHLLHCERADWLPRVRTILQWGEARTFEPLDRLGFQADGAVSLEERLDELARARPTWTSCAVSTWGRGSSHGGGGTLPWAR